MKHFPHQLRSRFLTPDSKLELWLRTQYHRLNRTRLFFKLQDWLAKRSYHRWKAFQKKQLLPDPSTLEYQPKVTFLVSLDLSSKQDLRKTIESIQKLPANNWEIILVSEQINNEAILDDQMFEDVRIKFYNTKTSNLLNEIKGEFVIFCQAGDQFFSGLLIHFYSALSDDDSADWYYYDCEFTDKETKEITPLFKPQSLSPALLLSLNYLSRGFIRRSYIKENWGAREMYPKLLIEEYELALYLCEKYGKTAHIPQVLVNQAKLVKPDTDEIQAKITEHLSHLGLENVSVQSNPVGTLLTWRTSNTSVAIIIPTKNNRTFLSNCLNSLKNKTNYQNYNIHIIDNNSTDPETLKYYRQLSSESNIKIHPYSEEFNYSHAINLGVSNSDSELVLFLNDDMEIFKPEWLTELVQWAIRPEIGVVGGKLIRADHTIQHAGIIIGLHGLAGHIYLNAPEHYQGLFGSVDWYRDYLALTGACQMVRREVFNQVGGYDEGYKIAFGDIDFCLRVHEAGYRNIYTPFATLFHYEGRSRGYITPQKDVLRAYDEMKSILTQEDPYFSPSLSYTRIPKCVLSEQKTEEREKIIEIRKRFHQK